MAMGADGFDAQAYWERLRPLGELRCRVLACLMADNPRLPTHFDPPADAPLAEALLEHLSKLLDAFADDTPTRRLLAAGLLTYGRLDMAEVILSELPAAPVVTDHGAGWCALLPSGVVSELLPLPEALHDPRRWVEGSTAAADLRTWFEQHRGRLQWDAAAERFVEVPG
jgi:hypothetical protein